MSEEKRDGCSVTVSQLTNRKCSLHLIWSQSIQRSSWGKMELFFFFLLKLFVMSGRKKDICFCQSIEVSSLCYRRSAYLCLFIILSILYYQALNTILHMFHIWATILNSEVSRRNYFNLLNLSPSVDNNSASEGLHTVYSGLHAVNSDNEQK